VKPRISGERTQETMQSNIKILQLEQLDLKCKSGVQWLGSV